MPASTSSPIGIVDIGLGNIKSVSRMIGKAGGDSLSISSSSDLDKVKKLILPGVGHYDYGMDLLNGANLSQPIREFAQDESHAVLGVCLGMQLLCHSSEEGSSVGLSLISAKAKRIPKVMPSIKIPHMGWNTIEIVQDNPLIPKSKAETRFYFVHSYHVVPDTSESVIATARHGIDFCAAFRNGNVYGVQFHPEKSHRFGLSLIRNFLYL